MAAALFDAPAARREPSFATGVRLLDAEPALGRFLSPGDRDALADLVVPSVSVGTGELELSPLLREHRAFGAVILDGMLTHETSLDDQVSLRPLGPGDVLGISEGQPSPTRCRGRWHAAAPTDLALLGRAVLLATRRAPALMAGLHARAFAQAERVSLQMTICQMTRVERRVLALFWLLADSWGQVTPAGTALRVRLTHQTIGRMIGARRPTVTIALGALAEEGAIVKDEQGWVLPGRSPLDGATTAEVLPWP
jgi:CRP/FNR family cyclic AMP-dependent transcriptional regulator